MNIGLLFFRISYKKLKNYRKTKMPFTRKGIIVKKYLSSLTLENQ